MYRYETNADGRVDVVSKERLKKNDLVVIKDDMYTGDMEVFRVRNVVGDKVEFRLMKAVGLVEDTGGNYEIDGITYRVDGRLNNNQLFVFGDCLGRVLSINRRRGESAEVEVEWLSYIEVSTEYIIYKRSVDSGFVEEYLVVDSYSEVIRELSKARALNNAEGTFWM